MTSPNDTFRRARQTTGYTLRSISERSGFSISYLSDLERGRRTFSLPAAAKLAVCCHCDKRDWLRRQLQAQLDEAEIPLLVAVLP